MLIDSLYSYTQHIIYLYNIRFMILFSSLFLFLQATAEDTVSFLSTSSELTLEGHAGLKLMNGDGNCYIGVFNSSYPFGINCRDYYPLYVDDSRRVHFGADVLTEADLKFNQKLVVSNYDQWGLYHYDTFEGVEADGWSNKTITECSGLRMLGGYCQFSAGTTWKEFTDIREHSLIRLRATWHFIDEWRGETAYVEIGTTAGTSLVWSLTYDVTYSKNPIDICGDTTIGEGKFAVPLDILVPHDDSDLVVIFGSTLEEQPCDKSWGISGLEIYIRG